MYTHTIKMLEIPQPWPVCRPTKIVRHQYQFSRFWGHSGLIYTCLPVWDSPVLGLCPLTLQRACGSVCLSPESPIKSSVQYGWPLCDNFLTWNANFSVPQWQWTVVWSEQRSSRYLGSKLGDGEPAYRVSLQRGAVSLWCGLHSNQYHW